MRTRRIRLAAYLFALSFSSHSFGIGSGGVLNLVPQARVLEQKDDQWTEVSTFRVYVHPMEGSILLIPSTGSTAIAFDKNKKHTIEVSTGDIRVFPDGSAVDVPEHTPFRVQREAPHFNRTFLEAKLDDGRILRVEVPR